MITRIMPQLNHHTRPQMNNRKFMLILIKKLEYYWFSHKRKNNFSHKFPANI